MSATTRVQITLEIQTDNSWGDDCSISQVKRQSIDSVNKILSKLLEKTDKIKMIGKAEYIVIEIKD